ncbi:hypothetical protein FRB99_007691 [Tulasnella sp. 403]|nr:hypothetical protein FRB99_007691 [Tulasnella sp. 403]
MDERTPLLVTQEGGPSREYSTTPSSDVVADDYRAPSSNARNAMNQMGQPLLVVGTLSLVACLITAFIFVITSGYHYAAWAAHVPTELLVKRGVVWKGPTNVEVLNFAEDAVTLRIDGAAGIDADWIMGLDEGDGGILDGPRRWFGHWLVERVEQVTVSVADVLVYAPYSRSQHRVPNEPLLRLSTPPVTVPLTVRRSEFGVEDDSWLTPLSIPVVIRPERNASLLVEYVEDALAMSRFLTRVEVECVSVVGGSGGKHWYNPWSLFEVKRNHIERVIQYQLPSPKPPRQPSNGGGIGSLVTLRSYAVHSNPPEPLRISAEADVRNPLPRSIHGSIKQPLDFTISLLPSPKENYTLPSNNTSAFASDPVPPAPIVRASTGPISISHPNISLSLSGTLLDLPPSALPLLSDFLSNFLSARPSPIQITAPPPFAAQINTVFPAPKVKPQIIKSITLRNMKIYADDETGEKLLAAGTIIAEVQLPDGLDEIKLDIVKILPDVIVFDGPPPPPSATSLTSTIATVGGVTRVGTKDETGDDEDDAPFPAPPLPSPLPPRAFSRIRPRKWLNSTCTHIPDPANVDKNITIVTAQIKDVPLDTLPGRGSVFTEFVQKVLFKGSAIAGIRGDAAVRVFIEGLPVASGKKVELKGLPVEGQFKVTRGGMHKMVRWRGWPAQIAE